MFVSGFAELISDVGSEGEFHSTLSVSTIYEFRSHCRIWYMKKSM
jgi:hypothetical protein